MPRTLLAAILLCVSPLTSAGINGWTAIGPAGGSILQIAYGSPAGTVFATTSSGFYRSQNGGSTWSATKLDFINAPVGLAVDPSDALRVYVAAPDWPSLYVSTDGGATLTPVTTLPTAVTQAWQVVVSQDGRTIFVSSAARVFRSTDRGLTWSERSPISMDSLARITRMVIDPADANRVYAAATLSSTTAGLLRTQDGGQTWQVLLSGSAAAMTVRDIAVSSANPLLLWAATNSGLYRSADRGNTFANLRPGDAASAVGIDPANPAVVYAGLQGALIRSADMGTSWTDVTHGHLAGNLATIAVNPAQGARVLIGGFAGLYGTLDAGATWSMHQAGILGSPIFKISSESASGRIYFNTASGGIHYATPGSTSTLPVDNPALHQLLAMGTQPLAVYGFLAQPGRLLASLSNGLARSFDGGNTWSLMQVAPTGTQQLFSIASTTDPQTLLAAGISQLHRSIDGGNFWTPINTGIPANANFETLFVAPGDGHFAYVNLYSTVINGPTAPLGIHRSTDGGLTWSPASGNAATDPRVIAVDPVVATTLYGTSETALLKSTNGGSSWSPLNWSHAEWRGSIGVLAVDRQRVQTLYAASVLRVARSVDGGSTWETLRDVSALPWWSPQTLFADPASPGTLYLGTASQGVQKIVIAPDLTLSGTAPAVPTGLGVPLIYRYTFGNQGPFDATGVRVSLQWPASATNVTVGTTSGACVVATAAANCTVDIFRMASTATVTLTATPASAGAFEIQASVVGDQSDANAANNAVALQTSVAALADLSVTVAGATTAQISGSVSHTLTVHNNGPNASVAPTLSFQLASGLTSASATSIQGSCNVNAVTALVTCALADLASGNSATVSVSTTATVAGALASLAQVTSITADGVIANNSASHSVAVSQAPTPPASGGPGANTGGGGGGGALSLWELLSLLAVAGRLARRYAGGSFARVRDTAAMMPMPATIRQAIAT